MKEMKETAYFNGKTFEINAVFHTVYDFIVNENYRQMDAEVKIWDGDPKNDNSNLVANYNASKGVKGCECKTFDRFLTETMFVLPTESIMNELIESVHGSGINGDWKVHKNKNNWLISNSFHTMDEYGGYCGWQDFTVKFPLNSDIIDFKIEFNGNRNYQAQKIDLKSYLNDLFADEISSLRKNHL